MRIYRRSWKLYMIKERVELGRLRMRSYLKRLSNKTLKSKVIKRKKVKKLWR